jgi:hypothetical protein
MSQWRDVLIGTGQVKRGYGRFLIGKVCLTTVD